jgi:hypothetical protein
MHGAVLQVVDKEYKKPKRPSDVPGADLVSEQREFRGAPALTSLGRIRDQRKDRDNDQRRTDKQPKIPVSPA